MSDNYVPAATLWQEGWELSSPLASEKLWFGRRSLFFECVGANEKRQDFGAFGLVGSQQQLHPSLVIG